MKNMIFKSPVTHLLILLNILVMLMVMISSGNLNDQPNAILDKFGAVSQNSPPWSILTYMFLHINIMHVLMNMFALWGYGNNLEERLGSKMFAVLYFISGLMGGIFVYFLGTKGAVGASGAVCGLVGGALMISLFNKIKNPKELKFILLDVVLLIGFSFMPQVSTLCHFGGFIGGSISMIIYMKYRKFII